MKLYPTLLTSLTLSYSLIYASNSCEISGTIKYTNAIYKGECKANKEHGEGTLTYNTKASYSGSWIDGHRSGYGIKKDSHHRVIYEGDWLKDKRDGQGKAYFGNAFYSGMWRENLKDGYGVYKFNNGATYKGEWVKNSKEGYGTLIYPDGSNYTGEWLNNKKNGYGTLIYNNAEKYEGEWLNDKRHGEGSYFFSHDSYYQGNWKKNKKNGYGLLVYSSGDIYSGEWLNDKRHGQGAKTTQYETCRGEWKNDKLWSLSNTNSYNSAYNYFNETRKTAGLNSLKRNKKLQRAAQNHSNYIRYHKKNLHGLAFHTEQRRAKLFTGVAPSDRAIAEGYLSKSVQEGIAHNCTPEGSINALMTAIYHRFTILSLSVDEVGIGFTQERKSTSRNFVHNPANSKLNKLCKSSDFKYGRYYTNICANKKIKVDATLYTNAKESILKKNPKYVLWPAADTRNNLYKFSGEVPDPMPDYKETGNPISIEFNPYYFKSKIELVSFKLFAGVSEISKTRILTKKTDLHHKFTEYQFALFPLKVLEKNSTYRAEFIYKIESKLKRINWSFKTKA